MFAEGTLHVRISDSEVGHHCSLFGIQITNLVAYIKSKKISQSTSILDSSYIDDKQCYDYYSNQVVPLTISLRIWYY